MDKTDKKPETKKRDPLRLSQGFKTDYFTPHIPSKIGELTITEALKSSESFGGTVTELYKAVSDQNEPLFVKSEPHSKNPMPYVLNPIGEFRYENTTYYVFRGFDGDMRDIFDTKKELWKCWNSSWSAENKEKFAAKVLLMLLLTLRDCYAFQYSNLDIKPQNILYHISDSEKAKTEIRIIDIAESSTVGEYTISKDVRFKKRGSTFWLAPALLRLFGNRRMEQANSDGSAKAAEYADIYSIGVIFFYFYVNDLLWKDRSITDAQALYKMMDSSYRDYYFRETSTGVFGCDSDDLKSYTPDQLSFAKRPADIAVLMCEMLSFPSIESPEFSREKWLDSLITRYCDILVKSDRLPEDLIIPPRYLSQELQKNAATVLIRLDIEMSEYRESEDQWSTLNQWTEYRCLQIARNSIVNVPFTIYHMYPLTDYVHRHKSADSLYLVNDRGIIRYVFYPKANPGTNKSEVKQSGEFIFDQEIHDVTNDARNGKKARLSLTFKRIKCKE